MSQTTCETDIVRNWKAAGLFYGLPVLAIVTAGSFGATAVTFVWPVALGVMGATCLVNATRCGRVHCYFTGPFFLLLAILSLTHGLGWTPLGPKGWTWIGDAMVVGTGILWILPELIFGRYFNRIPR